MMIKNILKSAALLTMAGCIAGCQSAKENQNCVDIAIFSINDFHAGFESSPSNMVPGAAHLLQTLDSLKKVYPYNMTLSVGDNFGGSYFYKLTAQRSPLPRLFSDLGITVSTLGNHEFDDSQKTLAEKWNYVEDRPEGWDIEYVCANVRDTLGRIPEYIKPWTVKPILLPNNKQVNVGITGLLTSNTPNQAKASNLVGLTFDGDYKGVLDSVAALPDCQPLLDADLRIVLMHIGTKMRDGQPIWEDRDSANIVSINSPMIDGLITGHSHDVVCGRINEAQYPVVQAKNYGAYIGMLKFTIDTTTMKVVAAEPHVFEVTVKKELEEKPRLMQEHLDHLLATTHHSSGMPIGEQLTVAKCDIPHDRHNKHRQTLIGRWACTSFAEAFRQTAKMDDKTPVIGVSHIGNLRTGIAKGPVRVLNVGEILPFNNKVRVYKMSGKQLKDLCNMGLNNMKYGYMQMGNAKVDLNDKREVQKITYVSPQGYEKEIGLKDYCYVAADEFMTTGGDGYPTSLFPKSTEVTQYDVPSTTNAFMAYLKTKPYIENK